MFNAQCSMHNEGWVREWSFPICHPDPPYVILSPPYVILSAAKDLYW